MVKKISPEIIITLLLFVILSGIALFTTTTGDNGDSILHYLYSREAFHYPAFFLHHWAKPVFVLLSAPFAQFGFKGIELFNCLCASLVALFTFYTARQLNPKNPYAVFIFIFFAPFCFQLIFSGLTEYLFALLLVSGIYFSSLKKHITAAILLSFLPLVRSEGLLVIAVFFMHYLLNKNYKALLFLAFGQLLYSFVGAFYYKDVLWVFTKIPYANMGSPYGHGQLTDLVYRLNYVIEKPIYLLLIIGLIAIAFKSIRTKFKEVDNLQLLIALTFLAFFTGHSIFWWRGIFNSMGLPRVFVSVMPLIALLSLTGLQAITERIHNTRFRHSITVVILMCVCLYPFLYRPQGVVYNKNLFTVPGNSFIAEQVAPYIQHAFPDYHQRRLYYNAPYLSMTLNVDHFNEDQRKDIHQIMYDAQIPASALVIWDNWFSPAESGISFNDMQHNSKFELVTIFKDPENSSVVKYAVFKAVTKK